MNRLIITLMVLLGSPFAFAHSASSAFLYWQSDSATARLDISLTDMQRLMPLDRSGQGRLYWRDVLAQQQAIAARLAQDVVLGQPDNACATRFMPQGIARYGDGDYLSLQVTSDCQMPALLRYTLFSAIDSEHRLLAYLERGEQAQLVVLNPQQGALRLDIAGSETAVFTAFVYQGMLHLWLGYDHMLFLLTLLLALCYESRKRDAGPLSARRVMTRALAVVTAFTVAHSITLVVATLGWVSLPIQWVEAIIAASIAVAAINVLWPIFSRRTYLLAFVFGLIHGFGFSSVLADLIDIGGQRAIALAGFNIGVEIAQAMLVVVCLPALVWMMRRQLFNQVAVPAMVIAISTLGMVWTVERALW